MRTPLPRPCRKHTPPKPPNPQSERSTPSIVKHKTRTKPCCRWQIKKITGLNEEAAEALDALCELPERFRCVWEIVLRELL